MYSGSEAGSYLRLIDSCITQLKAKELSLCLDAQTGLAEQRLALEEEAVTNNLQVFAESWKDPAEDLWKSLG